MFLKKTFLFLSLILSTALYAADKADSLRVPVVTWDSHSLMFDGKRVVPAMGEIHYSRIPAE